MRWLRRRLHRWLRPRAAVKTSIRESAAAFFASDRRTPPNAVDPRVRIDDEGVAVQTGTGVEEGVRWADLARVEIRTTSGGPWHEDVFWVLVDRRGQGCVVPSSSASSGALLERLQDLPGFDNQGVIQAMGSTGEAVFVCWEAASG